MDGWVKWEVVNRGISDGEGISNFTVHLITINRITLPWHDAMRTIVPSKPSHGWKSSGGVILVIMARTAMEARATPLCIPMEWIVFVEKKVVQSDIFPEVECRKGI